jgi:hypothetical protein
MASVEDASVEDNYYPDGMKQECIANAIAAFYSKEYAQAALFFATAELAGEEKHYVVLRSTELIAPDLLRTTATWTHELGHKFVWLRRCRGSRSNNTFRIKLQIQIQAGDTSETFQQFAFEIVPHGGVMDEGVGSI